MIIDLSHAHDITAKEAIEASDKPVIITHCGSRTMTYTMRMKPDDILQDMAEKGGVIGVEVAGFAPRTKAHPEATIECMLDHMKHLIELLGADYVGGGADSFYGDHSEMYRLLGEKEKRLPKPHYSRPRPTDIPPAFSMPKMRALTPPERPYVQGLEHPGEVTNVVKGLVRDGYSDKEITKVMGLNGMRVIKANWPR
jgi:membrane dipeptidase